MKDIGNKVSMTYTCDASSAQLSKAATALRVNYGYSSATYNSTYNYETVMNELSNKKPVILGGGRVSKWWFFNVYDDGHAWVADGMRITTQYHCHIPPYKDMDPEYLEDYAILQFRMNWGWDGRYDAWYGYNGFNPSTDTFNYKPDMITNIRP